MRCAFSQRKEFKVPFYASRVGTPDYCLDSYHLLMYEEESLFVFSLCVSKSYVPMQPNLPWALLSSMGRGRATFPLKLWAFSVPKKPNNIFNPKDCSKVVSWKVNLQMRQESPKILFSPLVSILVILTIFHVQIFEYLTYQDLN